MRPAPCPVAIRNDQPPEARQTGLQADAHAMARRVAPVIKGPGDQDQSGGGSHATAIDDDAQRDDREATGGNRQRMPTAIGSSASQTTRRSLRCRPSATATASHGGIETVKSAQPNQGNPGPDITHRPAPRRREDASRIAEGI